MSRCLEDNDDEVRDRAAFYLASLRQLGLTADATPDSFGAVDKSEFKDYITHESTFNWSSFEKSLVSYLSKSRDVHATDKFVVPPSCIVSKQMERIEQAAASKSISILIFRI